MSNNEDYLSDPVKFYAEKTVPVTFLPKKCPHCKVPMKQIIKLYVSWMTCNNENCSYLTTQELKTTRVGKTVIQDVPVAYTCNYMRK